MRPVFDALFGPTGMIEQDIERATIVTERASVLSFAREKARQAEQLIGRTLTADEAALVKRAVSVFADEIATGLHRQDADPPGVRAAMREVVRG